MGVSEQAFDVIVLGGGPSGSTAASLIAKAGHKVLLLERERFPRHQIGESLLPWTIHVIIPLLGVQDEIAAAGFTKKAGGVFRWGTNRTPWSFNFGDLEIWKDRPFAYQVRRAEFDHILLNNARKLGVDVREQHQFVEPITDAGGRCSGVRYRSSSGEEGVATAKFVVDATGHKSTLAGTIGKREYSPHFRHVALYCYYDNGKRMPAPNDGSILCQAFEDGWFWYIPLSPTLTSVGCVIARSHLPRVKQDPEGAMRDFIQRCPLVRDMLSAATRHEDGIYGEFRMRRDWSYCNTRFWGDGVVLIGDAACFVDPVFSTGVHLATYSGLLAARSINTVLGNGLDEKLCLEEFERRYRYEYMLTHSFLVSFYNQGLSEKGYFWAARKVLGTDESSHEAFLRLVSGAASTTLEQRISTLPAKGESSVEFLGELTAVLELHSRAPTAETAARVKALRELEQNAQREIDRAEIGVLVPSTDGIHWLQPGG